MKRTRQLLDALAPWAGLVVGLVAFSVVHQYGSDGTFDDCQAVSPGPLLIVALLGLLACAASALASWRTMRGSANEPRRVIAVISIGLGALFVFAIVLAIVAALVLPPCFG
jgi:tellurite resistance protein TehA-like permease